MAANPVLPNLKDLPLPQQLVYWGKHRPDGVALRQKNFGVWEPVTWAQYAEQARLFGLGLLQLGLLPGQSVAIVGENCKEWAFAELGIALVGGITAGIYPTSPADEVGYLLALSESPIAVCKDQEQVDKVLAVRSGLPHLRSIIVIDPKGLRRYDRATLRDFADIVALGRVFEREDSTAAAAACVGPRLDDIGLMVFTSGSTGRPKAAMMSWRGLGAAAHGLNSALGCGPEDQLVSYLPLCHVAEQMFSIHIPLASGAVVNFAESLRTVQEDLRERDEAARGRRPASMVVRARQAVAGAPGGHAADALGPVATPEMVFLVCRGVAGSPQLRGAAPVPCGDVRRGSHRPGDPEVLSFARRAAPRGLRADRGLRRDHDPT